MRNVSRQILSLLKGFGVSDLTAILDEVRTELTTKEAFVVHPNLTVTPREILGMFLKKYGEKAVSLGLVGNEARESYIWPMIDQVGRGMRRVAFGLENAEYEKDAPGFWGEKGMTGPRYFGSVPAVGFYAGDDFEFPVFFIVYLSADGETLCSYVPKNGNIWNYDTNSAFGNDELDDREFMLKWLTENASGLDLESSMLDTNRHPTLLFGKERVVDDIRTNFSLPVK